MSRIPILARRTILAAFITLAGSLLLLQGCGGGGGGGGGGGVTTPPGSSLPALWLAANNGTLGVELYRSDGTAAGTTLVKNINVGGGGSSSPGRTADFNLSKSIEFNGARYFAANNGTNGVELWKSDGTEAGTVMVKDINPGLPDSNPDNFIVMGNTLYFVATDATYGSELWKSDGTDAGTALVKDINTGVNWSSPSYPVQMGGVLYFNATTAANGAELWKSDGTDAGTMLVQDIYTGALGSGPGNFVVIGNTMYFSAYSQTYGGELWKSDGTTGGTALLKDITLGVDTNGYPQSSYISNSVVKGNEFYFFANGVAQNGGIIVGNATQLWKSNGTAAGTVLLRDLSPAGGGQYPGNLTIAGSTLYFTASNPANGNELWKSDGTVAGTVVVKDIIPGAGSGIAFYPYPFLTAMGNTLYFVASDGSTGYELWKSNGTDAGTVRVKDISLGSASSNPETGSQNAYPPQSLTVVGTTIYFIANNGSTGKELWKSDGTELGTTSVTDLNTGIANGLDLLLN